MSAVSWRAGEAWAAVGGAKQVVMARVAAPSHWRAVAVRGWVAFLLVVVVWCGGAKDVTTEASKDRETEIRARQRNLMTMTVVMFEFQRSLMFLFFDIYYAPVQQYRQSAVRTHTHIAVLNDDECSCGTCGETTDVPMPSGTGLTLWYFKTFPKQSRCNLFVSTWEAYSSSLVASIQLGAYPIQSYPILYFHAMFCAILFDSSFILDSLSLNLYYYDIPNGAPHLRFVTRQLVLTPNAVS